MVTRLQRFDFGSLRDFRGPAIIEPEETKPEEIVAEPPPPPTFSEEELEAAKIVARQQGHAEGYEAGLKHAAEQMDAKRQTAERTITHLAKTIDGLHSRYQQMLDQEAQELSQLVLLIARKVTSTILSANAADGVAELVTRCLPVILAKPQLMIDLNTTSFESTMDHIESLLQTSGFEGEIQFRSNAAIGPYDAILDWGTGHASRNTAELWQEIETLLTSTPITLTPLAQTTEPSILTAREDGPPSAETTMPV
jgi:flagellar assembly protein FliH